MAKRSTVLAEQLDAAVGEKLCNEIMQGWKEIASASPVKQAVWWKSAMDRLDSLVDEPTRISVMEQCGRRCAWKGVAEVVRKARAKSKTMDEFWDNLRAVYPRHVPLERDGFTIYASYTKCYCGRVKAAKEAISMTHCHCSKGYFLAAFEAGLGKPIPVDLLQSIINGATTCRFAIRIPPDEFDN